MDSISALQQRNDIRKARKRDPIASVFLLTNPSTCYSISVPPSKSWRDFISKLRKQFKLPANCALSLYEAPTDRTSIDLSHLHQYDLSATDMANIKHKCTFCVVVQQNTDKHSDSSSHSNSHSTDSSSASSQSPAEHKHQEPQALINAQERSFGIDLDFLGRLAQSKPSSKKGAKPVYHYHSPSRLATLDFNLKSTWKSLRSQSLTVTHIDEKYSLLTDAQNRFALRTRRLIWPQCLQQSHTFTFKPSDASAWTCAILILHGGKFAGAVYKGGEMVLHRTLSRYVTRKKQGKRQANHLSSGAKGGSAGGYKRARNERKLLEEVREVMGKWMTELMGCDRIMVHCPGVVNEGTLFGTNEEQSYLYPSDAKLRAERLAEVANKHKYNEKVRLFRLWKKDTRIRQVPINTHGVTLREVERVHYWMFTCWLEKEKEEEEDETG